MTPRALHIACILALLAALALILSCLGGCP